MFVQEASEKDTKARSKVVVAMLGLIFYEDKRISNIEVHRVSVVLLDENVVSNHEQCLTNRQEKQYGSCYVVELLTHYQSVSVANELKSKEYIVLVGVVDRSQ